MNKKVYFAGSIRGGRADAELYRRIIAYINRTDNTTFEKLLISLFAIYVCVY